ncbi:hypothetical protein PTTG_02018 [Puccinia triticina 1-1 BBBD Race 1]|uniref:CxC1-like cysteine cluster associated with KDZ transposases domain-containing protein n=1 Tax=Puccinia triticina (isolate 1-1 / race 1 (BBBD)) TaxID=630390 RepID=A0A180G2W9_PUCT1|nr:hypothetical protein PTTG_02018 [Puccinia triticina 1-1 BBBD Race 1]
MDGELQIDPETDGLDRCTQQHTAADDVRNGQTWKECDETGLFGMACRHDQMLRMINIVQSGEKAYYPMTMINNLITKTKQCPERQKLGILYDIGCNIEKGIIRRHQFLEEQELNLLKFGTSVFHAYVHEWSCQLQYNPRLNDGWEMSDGEGMERNWDFLSPLISQLRYSSANHRLGGLNIRLVHHNEMGKINSERGKSIEQVMRDAQDVLRDLGATTGHQFGYFKLQWERQREMQLSAMETPTKRETRELVEELVVLEDKIRDAHQEMCELRQTRRRNRTDSQMRQTYQEVLVCPFNLLYEAKVGVIEMQKRWDQRQSGTRVQARFKKQMNSKMNLFRKKWTAYNTRAINFNSEFSHELPLATPTFEEVKGLGIESPFWNTSQLDHPSEAWAVDLNTQKGIQAYLTLTHCQDELHRIAREIRQALKWAIERSRNMEQLLEELQVETDVLHERQQQLQNICSKFGCTCPVLHHAIQGNVGDTCVWKLGNDGV